MIEFTEDQLAPWRTSTVMAIARGMWDEKAFDRLPILADALQDAGCADDSFLDYVRSDNASGWHVTGVLLNKVIESKEELKDFASVSDLSYQELMSAARDFLKDGDYLCDGGKWEGHYVPDDFWNHYEVVTGIKVEEEQQGSFFSCSC